MSSSVTALDGDNTGEEHPHLVPETERGFWSHDTGAASDEPALPNPSHSKKACILKPPPVVLCTMRDGYFQTPTLDLYSLNSAEIHTGTHRNGFGTSFCMEQYFHQHWYSGTLPLRKDAFHFMSKQEWGWVTWFWLVSKADKVCFEALLKAAERQKGDRIWTRSNKYTITSTCSMHLDKLF